MIIGVLGVPEEVLEVERITGVVVGVVVLVEGMEARDGEVDEVGYGKGVDSTMTL